MNSKLDSLRLNMKNVLNIAQKRRVNFCIEYQQRSKQVLKLCSQYVLALWILLGHLQYMTGHVPL